VPLDPKSLGLCELRELHVMCLAIYLQWDILGIMDSTVHYNCMHGLTSNSMGPIGHQNSVWACRVGDQTGCGQFDRIELGVGMDRWSSARSNWVWAWTGGVRQDRTGCGLAEVEFGRIELGLGMDR
jgi:hypothetical protein